MLTHASSSRALPRWPISPAIPPLSPPPNSLGQIESCIATKSVILLLILWLAVEWAWNVVLSTSLPLLPTGVRLNEKSVFKLLKETGSKWDNVAWDILYISKEKCDEIRDRFSTDDDCLRESIRFWLKRCPLASYRWLSYEGVSTEFVEPLPGKKITECYW